MERSTNRGESWRFIQLKTKSSAGMGKSGAALTGTRLIREMEHTPLPEDVIYVPSMEELEVLPEAGEFARRIYGGLPIQIGYCNGSNHRLNALEYHRNSEINIAVTNMVLLLGWLPDVTDAFTYDTSKVEAFFVPAGTVVEMYGTTLHYAPCNDGEEGFKCIVILPKGTNTEIDFALPKSGEDALMTAKNKWLIAHEEAGIRGVFNGLLGVNIEV